MKFPCITAAVVACLSVSPVLAQQADSADIDIEVRERSVAAAQRKLPQNALPSAAMRLSSQPTQRYIIQLEEPSVATYKGGIGSYTATAAKATGQQRVNLKSAAVNNYAGYVQQRQKQVLNQVVQRVPEVALEGQLQVILNGMIVTYAGDDLPQRLRGVPGVKAVHADREVYVQTDSSNALIEAPAVWQQLGGRGNAGAGVNIAIIDTGIDPEHPMFQDAGHTRPDVGVTDDYCASVPTFCNDKLAVARYFLPPGTSLHPDEFADSPADFDGHGTHVAGTAAGNPVSTTYNGVAINFSGVAPGANLFVYKALWVNADGTTTGSSISLVEALEAAAADGADVINNSWGSLDNGAAPYEADVVQAIDAMGIINIAAAGNDGPGERTLGCPACIDEMFAVANTETGREFVSFMQHSDYAEPLSVTVGNGNFSISAPISGPFRTVKRVAPANEFACSAFSPDLFDQAVVLVQRGSCEFAVKANNLQAAGAVAMVLYNNVDGLLSMDMGAATLPSVAISNSLGTSLEQNWSSTDQVTINRPQQQINDDLRDRLNFSSSRGPNRDSTVFKPEIAAPGTNILSAYPNQSIALLSGTSMASPHVAGAAALLRALKPNWSHNQIKSALMSSAVSNIRQHDSEALATPHQIGAGRIDVAAAAQAGISFDVTSLNNNACIGVCSFQRTVTNLSNSQRTWQVAMSFDDANMSTSFPDSITLAAGESKQLALTLNTAFAEEGWQFGRLTLTDSSGSYTDANVPVAVFTSLSEDSSIISGAITAGTDANGTVMPGEPVQMRFRGALGFTNTATDFSIALPTDDAFVVDYDNIAVSLNASDQLSLTINEQTGVVQWQGNQNDVADSATVAPRNDFAFAGMTLADVAASQTITIESVCSEGCDDLVAEIELDGDTAIWQFDGTDHAIFSMWSNGLVEIGPSRALNTAVAKALPSATEPNGIVAPLWTDLEFLNGDGEMRYALVNQGSDTYLVLEWLRARSWVAPGDVDSGARFTFNAWFRLNSNEVFFNYVDVTSGAPTYATAIGLENMSGTVGYTHYYSANSIGSYPANGDALVANYAYGERASVVIDVPVTVADFGALTDVNVVGSSGRPASIDLSEQTELLGRDFITLMQISSTDNGVGVEYDAQLPLQVAPEGTLTGAVVSAPAHGTVTFDGLLATYTPEQGWSGVDSFTARLVDARGATSATATVTVDVTNTPPQVSVTVPSSVTAGETAQLDASASSDADGDTLSFQWQVVSGSGIRLNGANSAQASFVAPQVTVATPVQLKVVVSDGITTSEATVSLSVTPAPEKSSGAVPALMVVLLLPLLAWRRRWFY